MRNDELIKRVQSGLPGAFDQLFQAYVDRVHRKLYAVLGPDPDIDDVIQATFLRVFTHIDKFRGDSGFSTWLHRIALNAAYDHLRTRSRRQNEVQDLALDERWACDDQIEETVAARERARILYVILGRIHPKKRMVFTLYEIEGCTLEEIADSLEISINTVAARLRAARKEVRKQMHIRLAARPSLKLGLRGLA